MAKLSDLSLYDQFEYAKRFNQFPANGTLTEFINSRPASQASQAADAPIPQINELTPDQINEEFYKGYPKDLPQRMKFLDYLNPKSYIDPRAADRVMPQNSATQTVAPVDNRGSMPSFNLGNLTNYIPSASTIGEYIPTSLPNVFGVNNPLYAGLLGADQSQALSKQSNIAGLLGAAAALVQGMGRQGGRRSAAQNIISALGAGYGAAGQQYQQGLQMYGQTQQLGLQQRQQAAIQAMKLKYPEYADEIDANPAGAFRLIAEREAAGKKLITAKPGEVIFDPTGKQIAQVPAEVKEGKQEVFTGDYGNLALAMFQTAKASELSAPQREALSKRAEQLGIGKPASTNLTVNTGELSKGTKGKVEEGVLSSAEAVGRLNNIWGTYKPEYLKVPFRLKQEWSGLASKFKDIPETDKKILAGYSTFKQNSLENLNQTIKALTGAAMGVQEADRIIASLPNAGTTVFGGDSPDEFEAKLVNAVEKTKYALARQTYALKLGINKDAWEKIKLDDMPSIVLQRENELGKKYYGDNFNKNDVKQRSTIKRQLAAEFGIPF
jgi:hypothetical protein